MSDENPQDQEAIEVTELDEKDLEDVSGGAAVGDTNCGCGDTNCGCSPGEQQLQQ